MLTRLGAKSLRRQHKMKTQGMRFLNLHEYQSKEVLLHHHLSLSYDDVLSKSRYRRFVLFSRFISIIMRFFAYQFIYTSHIVVFDEFHTHTSTFNVFNFLSSLKKNDIVVDVRYVVLKDFKISLSTMMSNYTHSPLCFSYSDFWSSTHSLIHTPIHTHTHTRT